MVITGLTRFVPLLAHPSKHVRTPGVFNKNCQSRNIDLVMVPLDVLPERLDQTVEALRHVVNLAGFVVTIPHKTKIAGYCDRLVGAAQVLNVCNVVRREPDGTLTGSMFDGEGFVEGLRQEGHNLIDKKALLIGAGGAASGIAHALISRGIGSLVIANRSSEKAEQLAGLLREHFSGVEIKTGSSDPYEADLIINGTSLGMHPRDGLPVDPTRLRPGTIVAEVVMQPDVTRLLKVSAERGCVIHKGIHMVRQQINLLVDFLN